MKTQLIRVLFAAVLIACGLSQESAGRVDVILTSGVDTTDVDKRAIFELWVEYLNSEPVAMWSRPDWNAEKSRLWRNFDLTATLVYGASGDSILARYVPTVMAIDQEAEGRYSIRTLFYDEDLTPPAETQNPRAIVRVYAERAGDSWKLRNSLGVLTEHWHRPAIGKITFVSAPSHEFNISRALRSIAFCDSIGEVFEFFKWGSFDFYVAGTREEADRIIGLEFILDGFPRGRAFPTQDILVWGGATEWYPNGLALMVATGPGLDPHEIVRHGFAGWIGGWDDKSYRQNMGAVSAFVSANGAGSFDDFVTRRRDFEVAGAEFFPGAVLCDMVYSALGVDGIKVLFESGSTDDGLYAGIESTLGLDRRAFQRAWQQKVLEFTR